MSNIKIDLRTTRSLGSMVQDIIARYAHLLVHYSLALKPGDKLCINSTSLAEPLFTAVYTEATKCGALVEMNIAFEGMNKSFYDNASEQLLQEVSPLQQYVMNHFDAYLVIRAPFMSQKDQAIDSHKLQIRTKAQSEINAIYFQRTADGSMRRSLCQYPTELGALEAGMTLDEYSKFIFNACNLYTDDAEAAWLEVRKNQQHIVDFLNTVDVLTYKNGKSDMSCSVKNRMWINSDGRANMPSGEVFTGPIEESVNGIMHFDYPSIYSGEEVKGITLKIKDGEVVDWTAEVGQSLLDRIMQIEGARYFGEIAIGTNYNIQTPTKNILFDEKIGGTVHMAIGQSYIQTGGKNKSAIHWDMIADMTIDGEIWADGRLIYEKGKFLI